MVGALVVGNDIIRQGWKFELSETLFYGVLVVQNPDIFQIYSQYLYSLDQYGSTKGCWIPISYVPLYVVKISKISTKNYNTLHDWSKLVQNVPKIKN